jgi:hypothetical protein
MLEGNMFFDEQGMPILKIALNRILFEEALPEPFSVATQILRSLIDGSEAWAHQLLEPFEL